MKGAGQPPASRSLRFPRKVRRSSLVAIVSSSSFCSGAVVRLAIERGKVGRDAGLLCDQHDGHNPYITHATLLRTHHPRAMVQPLANKAALRTSDEQRKSAHGVR